MRALGAEARPETRDATGLGTAGTHGCSVEEGIDDAAGSHEDRGITTKMLPCLEEILARNTVDIMVTRSRHEGKRYLDTP